MVLARCISPRFALLLQETLFSIMLFLYLESQLLGFCHFPFDPTPRPINIQIFKTPVILEVPLKFDISVNEGSIII